MAQPSVSDCLMMLPQWTSAWADAVRSLESSLEARSGQWYHTRVGRLWRAIGARERRALILIAMANSRRPTEGRMIDESNELLLVVCKYLEKAEVYVDTKRDGPNARRSRRTEEGLRVHLHRRRLAQRVSSLMSRATSCKVYDRSNKPSDWDPNAACKVETNSEEGRVVDREVQGDVTS